MTTKSLMDGVCGATKRRTELSRGTQKRNRPIVWIPFEVVLVLHLIFSNGEHMIREKLQAEGYSEEFIKDIEAMVERKIPCEVWTRTVGYFRPTTDMNKGKREEVSERRMLDIARMKLLADVEVPNV